MLRKRLIATIVVRAGWAVQSMGYRRYLPLGRPEVIAENLDRWGADEIIVMSIDRSRDSAGPDFALLDRIAALGLRTPLVLAGGIRSEADAVQAIRCGADRICVDAMLHDDPTGVRAIAERIGAQAVVGALPLSMRDGSLQWLDYRTGAHQAVGPALLALLAEKRIAEALLIDWCNEGKDGSFDMRLVRNFPDKTVPLLAFGGAGSPQKLRELLAHPQVAGAAVGNLLSHREHAIQQLKLQLGGLPVREAAYLTENLE